MPGRAQTRSILPHGSRSSGLPRQAVSYTRNQIFIPVVGRSTPTESMITRAKLVEQLREYQIRSQPKCAALTIFSPKPLIISRADVFVAVFWAFVWSTLFISSYATLYYRHFGLSSILIFLGILIPIRLRSSRRALARKKETRFLLSM